MNFSDENSNWSFNNKPYVTNHDQYLGTENFSKIMKYTKTIWYLVPPFIEFDEKYKGNTYIIVKLDNHKEAKKKCEEKANKYKEKKVGIIWDEGLKKNVVWDDDYDEWVFKKDIIELHVIDKPHF